MAKKLTYEEGLEIAKKFAMDFEYQSEIDSGCTPEEALEEWDILPDDLYGVP